MNALLITQSTSGPWTVISIAGEIDVATAPGVLNALEEVKGQGVTKLIFDLSRVTFMDSTGLGVMVTARRELDDGLRLVVTESNVRKVFEVTGLDTLFQPYASLHDAVIS